MKKIKLLLPFVALLLFSCDNYTDINQNPNDVTYKLLNPTELLSAAQTNTFRTQTNSMNELGNVLMNSWAGNVQSFTGAYSKEYQLNLDSSFYSNIWDGLYRSVNNFDNIVKYPNPSGEYDSFIAVSKICKVHYMQYIVDLYGNCPYSDAFQYPNNVSPKYDDDFDVYKSLISELKSAKVLLNNLSTNAIDITPYDVMLKGDMVAWYQFANTLHLRLLVRMRNSTNPLVVAYLNQELPILAAEGDNYIQDDVKINPGYSITNDSSMNPSVNYFAYNSTGALQQNRTFITASGHAYKSLQSYSTTNWPVGSSKEIVSGSGVNYLDFTDPRSAKLFTAPPSNTLRRAVTQGSVNVDVGPVGFTTGGLPCRLGLSGNFNPYGTSDGTLPSYAAIDGFVFTYSQACFLKAEAAIFLPQFSFLNAQNEFDNGIDKDMLKRNVASGSAYKAYISTIPNFGLIGSNDNKLHAILYQKWIALMGVNGMESYLDYIRTGFPLTPMPLASSTNQTRKPYRLVYPTSEYVANTANVPSVTAADCFTLNSKTPFWVPGALN